MNTQLFSVTEAKAKAAELANHKSLDLKNGACLISVEVSGGCGERTIADSKSVLDGEVLDSDLVSGTKLRWFPTSELKFVNTKSNAVRRTLNQYGVSIVKGTTLVPIKMLPTIMSELELMSNDFNDSIDDIKRRYDAIIDGHCNANPDIAHHIRKCVPPVSDFAGRFSFRIHPPMAIQPLFDGDEAQMAKSVATTLLDEVAEEATAIWKKSYCGAERATFKKLRPVLALRDKLMNLSFLDPSVEAAADHFDSVLDKLPKSNVLEGADFQIVANFLLTASDALKLKAYGEVSEQPVKDEDESIQATPEVSESTADASQPIATPPNHQVDEQALSLSNDEDEQEVETEVPLEHMSPPPVMEQPSGSFHFDDW